jgi:hypothetical protein
MKKNIYIGIDNGVSGTIGIVTENEYFFYKTPVFSQQDYVKTKSNITRVNQHELYRRLLEFEYENVFVAIERPMINSLRFKSSLSAIRALETTLNVLELLGFSHIFCDSF